MKPGFPFRARTLRTALPHRACFSAYFPAGRTDDRVDTGPYPSYA
jgi:hypothetical protein